MPDLINPESDKKNFVNSFKRWDRVVYKGLDWLVLDPNVGLQDGRDLALIGAGEYGSIRDVVFADELQFPQVDVD